LGAFTSLKKVGVPKLGGKAAVGERGCE